MRQEISREEKGQGSSSSTLLQRLNEVQARSKERYVSKEVLKEIADELEVSTAFARGVATFYSMLSKRPRGRHIVRVCESPPCRLAGGMDLVVSLQSLLGISAGETTADGMFTLEFSSCLGACDKAPALLLDDALYTQVAPEDLPRILDEARKLNWIGPKRTLSAVLGKPRYLLRGVGEVDVLEDAVARSAYQGLKRALTTMTPEEVTSCVKDSGLRGRGGAGFPTGRKWEFSWAASGEQKYLVCNADEGEPGTFKDRLLLEWTPHRVIEGMLIAGYAIQAVKGFLYIRGEYAAGIDTIEKALEQARHAGYLGKKIFGSSFSFDIEVVRGAGAYVCGEETSLIESLEGKRGFPRLRPPYPAAVGCWGKPTVINNVETLANVPEIVRDGVKAYRRLGTDASPGTKLYPLSGAVARAGVVEAEMGVTLRTLIDEHGGGMPEGRRFLAALVGGAAGVFFGEDMLNVPLEYDSLAAQGAVLGSGAVFVLDTDCNVSSLIRDILRFFAHESCGQCVPCRVGTTRLEELMETVARKKRPDREIDVMLETARWMQETSLCPLGQSCYPLLKSAVKVFQGGFFNSTSQKERGNRE